MYTKAQQTRSKKVNIPGADNGKEDVLQGQCEEYLRVMNIEYWRFPDNAWRFIHRAAPVYIKKLFSDYFKGKPDLTVLLDNGKYLNVELKTKKGALTQGQKNFAKRSELYVVRSFDGFKKLVDEASSKTERVE